MNISSLLRNKRLCLAITGLTPQELLAIQPEFEVYYHEAKILMNTQRKRKFGAGRIGSLETSLEKLVFILMYVKCYPTFDLIGFYFDMWGSTACRNMHSLRNVLEKTLKRNMSLPKRRISTPQEFEELFPGITDVFIDGSERRVQKPRVTRRRNKLYSGKKKATTRKGVIVSDIHKQILILTPTKSGRRHDKRIADKNMLARNLPEDVTAWVDTGFQGFDKLHKNTMIPKKRGRKRPLTSDEKEDNRFISQIRVVAEHAIGGMKRFKAATDIYRNRLENIDDHLSLISAGLWNYHILSNP